MWGVFVVHIHAMSAHSYLKHKREQHSWFHILPEYTLCLTSEPHFILRIRQHLDCLLWHMTLMHVPRSGRREMTNLEHPTLGRRKSGWKMLPVLTPMVLKRKPPPGIPDCYCRFPTSPPVQTLSTLIPKKFIGTCRGPTWLPESHHPKVWPRWCRNGPIMSLKSTKWSMKRELSENPPFAERRRRSLRFRRVHCRSAKNMNNSEELQCQVCSHFYIDTVQCFCFPPIIAYLFYPSSSLVVIFSQQVLLERSPRHQAPTRLWRTPKHKNHAGVKSLFGITRIEEKSWQRVEQPEVWGACISLNKIGTIRVFVHWDCVRVGFKVITACSSSLHWPVSYDLSCIYSTTQNGSKPSKERTCSVSAIS